MIVWIVRLDCVPMQFEFEVAGVELSVYLHLGFELCSVLHESSQAQ